MTRKSFYIDFYQAILDDDFDLIHELTTSENIENYSQKHLFLNYKDIFQDNNPLEFLKSMIKKPQFRQFYNLFKLCLDILEDKEKVFISRSDMIDHPIINYCPNQIGTLPIIDSILSNSYSKTIKKDILFNGLTKLLRKSIITSDALKVVARSAIVTSDFPLSISFIEKDTAYDPTIVGHVHPASNSIIITNDQPLLNLGTTAHELSHQMNLELFNNNYKPYNITSEKIYHEALKDTLLNVAQFITPNLKNNIILTNQNNTYKIGKILSEILFPIILEEDIDEFILSLEQFKFDINNRLPGLKLSHTLEPFSFLEHTLLYNSNFKLANALISKNINIENDNILHLAVILKKLDVLHWFLENKKDIDINYINCNGETALDLAKDPKIIKTLISSGSIAYPPNHKLICPANDQCKNIDKYSPVKQDTVKALSFLLSPYREGYTQKKEAVEFIVRLPEIIAKNLYKGKVIEILQPMDKYWQDVISPAAQEYIDKHDPSDICLATGELQDFYL